jgi:hypothetical protein
MFETMLWWVVLTVVMSVHPLRVEMRKCGRTGFESLLGKSLWIFWVGNGGLVLLDCSIGRSGAVPCLVVQMCRKRWNGFDIVVCKAYPGGPQYVVVC